MTKQQIQRRKKPRVREKIKATGIASLTDEQLLMVLLGSGTHSMPVPKLSKEIMKHIGETDVDVLLDKIISIPGIGWGKASIIASALELGRRRHECKGTLIKTPEDFIPLVTHYTTRNQEYFLCASLNGAHEVLEIRVVTMGLLNRTVVHPREVYAEPLKDRAAAIIICHNHPSGQLSPSSEDIDVTDRIRKSGEILGIRLLDHLIITKNGYFSFVENGMMKE